MAKELLTMLDLAKRRGTDKQVGLVEEVVNYAPEIDIVMGRPIPGTFYDARIRSAITGGGAFRKANAGGSLGASTFEMRRFNTSFFDSHLQVDEAIMLAADQQGDSLGDLQADEVSGALRDKAIKFGRQFYAGSTFDKEGFPGLIDFLNTYNKQKDSRTGAAIDVVVDAQGNDANCSVAWFIWMHEQGVHFLFGGNKAIDVNPWTWQYVQDDNNPKKRLRASVSNLSGHIGLSCASPFAVGCIKNINPAHPLTDALIQQLEAKLPVGYAYNGCFVTKRDRQLLQASRSVTLFANANVKTKDNSGAAGAVAPVPTETTSGIPITVTDGIVVGAAF